MNEIDPHPLDSIPPDSLDDIDLVSKTHSESKKLVSEVWKDFTPVYVDDINYVERQIYTSLTLWN